MFWYLVSLKLVKIYSDTTHQTSIHKYIFLYWLSYFTFRDRILDYNETRNSTDDKLAFVVPAFDGARNVVGL